MSAVIPQFRNKQLLRQAQVDLRYTTKVVAKFDRDMAKQARNVVKQEMKTLASRPGTAARVRAEEKFARETELLQQIQTQFDDAVRERNQMLASLQAIEALPEEPANYVPVDTEEKYSQEDREPAEVTVRLMSGDLFAIEIDLNDEIHFFPKQFAREAGYNPAAVSRMVFFVDGADEALIDPDEVNAVITEHITWMEKFADIPNPDALPMLNLFIRPDSEKDREAKISLIRQILEQKKLNDNISDPELFSHYSEWNLRYQPPRISNRYITMSSFIEQNSHLFPVLTEEEMEAAKERKAHRDMVMNFHLFRRRELRWVQDKLDVYGDRFNVPRLAVQEELRQLVAVATEQGAEVVFNTEQQTYFRRSMAIPEIVDMGVRSENICACSHGLTCFISCWTHFSAEADAMGLLLD